MGEPEVDRHAPALLLFEAVGIDAGQGLDQGRLSVVDVTSSADDEIHFLTALYAASRASMSVSSSPRSTVRGSMQQASASMRASTGGEPRRSAAASRDAGPSSTSRTVGSSWPGREPPPAAESPATSRAGTSRSASFTIQNA